MKNYFIKVFITVASCTFFLASCGSGNSAFEDPATSSDIKTQIPDQDSLTVTVEKVALEGLDFNGEELTVTVQSADRNNNPVPDNTAIRFITNGGSVEPQCLTVNGECTVTWTEHDPTPPSLRAIILAYTSGEESFTDLNGNDKFDAGEPFTDISEPFFDINNNGVRDAATEEFVDADNDNTFDTADGLFTGQPCVGDNTVCNRVNALIWDRQIIILSDSTADISITSGSLPTSTDTPVSLNILVTDVNGNAMADGTAVKISTTGGSATPATVTLAPGQTTFTIQYTSGSTAGNESLTIEVTSPSGLVTPFTENETTT